MTKIFLNANIESWQKLDRWNIPVEVQSVLLKAVQWYAVALKVSIQYVMIQQLHS